MPKINFNARSICAAIGTGALCATLSLAPIATNLMMGNGAVYAGGGAACSPNVPMPSSWDNVQISKGNFTDILNSAKKVDGYDAFAKFQNADNTMGETLSTITSTLITEAKAAGAIKDWYDFDGRSYESVIEEVKKTDGYDTDTALQAAVSKAEKSYAEMLTTYKNAIKAAYPSINVSDTSDSGTLRNRVIDHYNKTVFGESIFYQYESIFELSKSLDPSVTQDDGSFDYKYAAYELVCAATQIDPNFKVNYILSTDPFGDNGGDITTPPTGDNANTDNKPSNTIESSDKNVKVSGVNININYTLNVDKVADDLLKLTGNNFKNSLNQAFYDIYIRDSLNNVVTDTGKVQVSIKLPSNMNVNSDFVVYYVPMAMNGEYLTDQAQAIKGVKVSSDGWLTFETDHFSVYGIVEYPKGKAPNSGVIAKSDGSSAATAGIKIAAGVVSVLTAAGATIVARRQILRKKNNK